jgi:hypothetical protein
MRRTLNLVVVLIATINTGMDESYSRCVRFDRFILNYSSI